MDMLLFFVLPSLFQNALTFGICLAEEMRLLIICIGVAIPAWQRQIIAFDLIKSKLQEIRRALQTRYILKPCAPIILNSPEMLCNYDSVSNEWMNIGEHYAALRCVQLYIALLNVVNSKLIFTWKLLCLGMCIMSGYAAIAHLSDHTVFGVMYFALFLEGSIIYAVMYEQAFKVPDLIT